MSLHHASNIMYPLASNTMTKRARQMFGSGRGESLDAAMGSKGFGNQGSGKYGGELLDANMGSKGFDYKGSGKYGGKGFGNTVSGNDGDNDVGGKGPGKHGNKGSYMKKHVAHKAYKGSISAEHMYSDSSTTSSDIEPSPPPTRGIKRYHVPVVVNTSKHMYILSIEPSVPSTRPNVMFPYIAHVHHLVCLGIMFMSSLDEHSESTCAVLV
jgi:hypothetical protein